MLGDRATFRDKGNPYARVPPSGGVSFQNFARNPVLVNERLSAPCYRPQTLASNLAKSLIEFIGGHIPRKISQGPVQEVRGHARLRLFSPPPRPSFGSWQRAQRHDGL